MQIHITYNKAAQTSFSSAEFKMIAVLFSREIKIEANLHQNKNDMSCCQRGKILSTTRYDTIQELYWVDQRTIIMRCL